MKNKSNDILTWSITDLANALEEKKVSPVEVTKLLIEKIGIKDTELNSYITVMENLAMRDAMQAEEEIQKGNYKGVLHGIPIAIKDNIFIKGVKNTIASEVYKDYTPDEDAEIVRKLRSAGATIIGKTNLHEFSFGPTGDRSYFGPAKNPHNTEKITGGSSSGSAAAVAGHLAYGAIGTDAGGSIRMPSSFCGIVGMLPTFGSVSSHGKIPLCFTTGQGGPMTKTVKDNAILLNALIGYDSKDPHSIQRKKDDFTEEIGETLKGLTIGIPSNYYYDNLQPEVRESINETIDELMHNGVEIKSVTIDLLEDLLAAFQIVIAVEGFSANEKVLREQPDKIGEEVRSRMLMGVDIDASDYLRALKIKHRAIQVWREVFTEADVILTPTMSILPTDINQRHLNINGAKTTTKQILGRLTSMINPIGFPAISVPGIPKNGLPVGLQLIGKPFSEKKLYRFASFIENMLFSS